MIFLIDAQLPYKMCEILENVGFEAAHVNSLPRGDETPDRDISTYADDKGLMLITKDSDFYHSHMVLNKPCKLFLIATGNIKNKALFDLVRENASIIKELLDDCSFIEMTNEGVVGHN